MMVHAVELFVAALVLGQAWGTPLVYREPEARPLAVVSELGARLASHSARLPEPGERLPLPSPQELEAIRKVAQILVMLGEQVIPTIIGESTPHSNTNCDTVPVEEVPNDAVNEN